jgi:hypothetical protein
VTCGNFDEWWKVKRGEHLLANPAEAAVAARAAWDAATAAERKRCVNIAMDRGNGIGVSMGAEGLGVATAIAGEITRGEPAFDVLAAATAAERERLGRPPAGQYRCGCPLVVCDNIKAFCPAHHKTILPVGEPT